MTMVMLAMGLNIMLPKNMIRVAGNMKGGTVHERCHRECGFSCRGLREPDVVPCLRGGRGAYWYASTLTHALRKYVRR